MIKPIFDCVVCGGKGMEVMRNNLSMYICNTCGLFWRKNFELDDRHYEQRSFELENKEKINIRYANSLERIETLRKYINLNDVCDIGCGEGVFLKALSDLGYKNTIGLEPSIKARNYASANNLNIFEGEIESVNGLFFKKHNAHIVTMFHVIEHLKNPKEVLKGIYDNLTEGDHLVIETPDTDSRIFTKTNYRNKFIYPEHLFYFNKNNLQKLLKEIGFTSIASGNRDFNEKNLGIRESISRLGIIDGFLNEGNTKTPLDDPSFTDKKINNGILRTMVRKLLSKVVIYMGRGNYLWVIVKK